MSTTTTTPAHTVTLVNMTDGTVSGHKALCADLKRTRDHASEPWTLEVANKIEAWKEYNADFLAECDEHEDFCNEDRGICSHAWDIRWAACADGVPEGDEDQPTLATVPAATEPVAPKRALGGPKVTIGGKEFRACGCNCGAPVSGKATYRPGHDARHAGQVARDAVASFRAGDGAVDSDEFYMELTGRPALIAKARKMALGLVAKEDGKKAARTGRKTEAQAKTGTVKVGRWEYPVRMTLAGKAQRNTKRDGSGDWEAVAPEQAAKIVWA